LPWLLSLSLSVSSFLPVSILPSSARSQYRTIQPSWKSIYKNPKQEKNHARLITAKGEVKKIDKRERETRLWEISEEDEG
jgi:hypothetical protein